MTIIRSKDDPEKWDEYLQAVLFSYRCSINDATGYSPYFLMNGRIPTLPTDLIFAFRHEKYNSKTDYVNKIAKRLDMAFELAIRHQYAAARENEDRASTKTQPNFELETIKISKINKIKKASSKIRNLKE